MKPWIIDHNIIHSFWGCSFVSWCYLASLNASRGVLLIWDKKVLELIEDCIRTYTVVISFKNIEDG